MRTKRLLNALLNVATGAVAVMGGIYIFSRLKEKHKAEVRLERLEQIVEELSSKDAQNKAESRGI